MGLRTCRYIPPTTSRSVGAIGAGVPRPSTTNAANECRTTPAPAAIRAAPSRATGRRRVRGPPVRQQPRNETGDHAGGDCRETPHSRKPPAPGISRDYARPRNARCAAEAAPLPGRLAAAMPADEQELRFLDARLRARGVRDARQRAGAARPRPLGRSSRARLGVGPSTASSSPSSRPRPHGGSATTGWGPVCRTAPAIPSEFGVVSSCARSRHSSAALGLDDVALLGLSFGGCSGGGVSRSRHPEPGALARPRRGRLRGGADIGPRADLREAIVATVRAHWGGGLAA